MELDALDLLYQGVLESSSKEFFIELQRYTDYLFSELKFKRILSLLHSIELKDSKEYNKASELTISESKRIYEILKKEKVVLSNSEDFDKYLSGQITSSRELPESLLEILGDLILGKPIEKIKEDIKTDYQKVYNIYYKEKNKFILIKRRSVWNSLRELLTLKLIDADTSSYNLMDKVFLSLFKDNKEKIISGNEKISDSERIEYLSYLKRVHSFLHIHQKEIKVFYIDDLKDRMNQYNKRKKDSKYPFLIFLNSFNKELNFILGIFVLLVAAFLFKASIIDTFKIILTHSYNTLGLPKLDLFFISLVGVALLFIFLSCQSAKIFLNEMGNFKNFLNRFCNGYVILAIFLIFTFTYIGMTILEQNYGSSLPKTFDITSNPFKGYENFYKENIEKISPLFCEGYNKNRFFIENIGAICNFSLSMKEESNYSLYEITTIVSSTTNTHTELYGISSLNYQNIWLNLNETGDFRISIHFLFKDNKNNDIKEVYYLEYKDKAFSEESIKELEDKKNVLLISLISLVLFSVLSAVVNLKKLTEKKESS